MFLVSQFLLKIKITFLKILVQFSTKLLNFRITWIQSFQPNFVKFI